MKIKITADRIIDLSKDELKELGIATISCYINMDDKSCEDMVDVFPQDIFDYMSATKKVAKTAAKSPEQYQEFFQQFIDEGYHVIHLAASSGISAICSHAQIAAKKLGDKVQVIDSHSLSNGIALLAKLGLQLIKEGKEYNDIYITLSEKVSHLQTSFLLNTLEALYRGGRCSGMKYLATALFNIKPAIFLDQNGVMKVREKYRGSQSKILEKYIRTTFEKYPNPDLEQLYVMLNSPNKDTEIEILRIVKKYYDFKKIDFNSGSCNSSVHSGSNTIGLFYLTK